MEKPKVLYLFGTIVVSSCAFDQIENETGIISGPSIDVYDVVFIKCNTISHSNSISSTDRLFMTNTIFENSGGAETPDNELNPPSTVRVYSARSSKAASKNCFKFAQANIEMSHINLTNNKSKMPLNARNGPQKFITKFVSLISNECQICAKLEANYSCVNKNSHYQFVRNNCSECLLDVYRADGYCDWFYFINNNVTSCRQFGEHTIIFTNSFRTDDIMVLKGATSGVVKLDLALTELPFPPVMKRRVKTGALIKPRISIAIFLNFFFF